MSINITDDLKKVLSVVGYNAPDDATEIDETAIRDHINSKWILREFAPQNDDIKKQISGKLLNSLTNNAKKVFGFTEKDVEGKKFEEVMEFYRDQKEQEVKELKKTLSEKDVDKQVKTLQKQLEDLSKERDDFKNMAENKAGELEQEREGRKQFEDETKVKLFRANVRQSLMPHLKSDISEQELKFLEFNIDDKYRVDVDGEKVIPKTKDGHIIEGEGGKPKTLEQLYSDEAKGLKFWKNNKVGDGGEGTRWKADANGRVSSGGRKEPIRQVHPDAQK